MGAIVPADMATAVLDVLDLPAAFGDADPAESEAKIREFVETIAQYLVDQGVNTTLADKSGREPIGNGATNVSVSFAEAYPDANYTVVALVQDTNFSAAVDLGAVLAVQSTTGFTVEFAVSPGTADYVLHWITKHD